MIGRRGFITGLVSLVAAPAIVRAGSLMPVRVIIEPVYGIGPAMQVLDNLLADLQSGRRWHLIDWECTYTYVVGDRIQMQSIPPEDYLVIAR